MVNGARENNNHIVFLLINYELIVHVGVLLIFESRHTETAWIKHEILINCCLLQPPTSWIGWLVDGGEESGAIYRLRRRWVHWID